MPEPWELTEEEARLVGERLRERLLEADRIAAPRFAKQLAELAAAEAPVIADGRTPTVRRYAISQSLGEVERAHSGGDAIGGTPLTLVLRSELFSYWLDRQEKLAFLLVERSNTPQNNIESVKIEDTAGNVIARCDSGALDRYGRARLPLGTVASGRKLVFMVESRSPLGEDRFELEISWD